MAVPNDTNAAPGMGTEDRWIVPSQQLDQTLGYKSPEPYMYGPYVVNVSLTTCLPSPTLGSHKSRSYDE
jgi:hypothetical protein